MVEMHLWSVDLEDVTGPNQTMLPTTSQLTQVQMQPEQGPEGLRHHDDRVAEVGKIHHEQRQGSHGGKQELVSPTQVQDVVSKAQEDHATDGQKCTNQLYKLIHPPGRRQQHREHS